MLDDHLCFESNVKMHHIAHIASVSCMAHADHRTHLNH